MAAEMACTLRRPLCRTSKDPWRINDFGFQGANLDLLSVLLVLISPSLPGTPSLAPAQSHKDVVPQNGSDLLSIIVDSTFNHLPEATQLTQNRNKKKSDFCDNALSLVIVPVAGLISCYGF